MAISTSDVMGWWDFQEGSGTSVADEIPSGKTNVSLVNTPAWTTGGPTNLPNGVDFNGSNQYGVAAKDYDFSPQEGTGACWVLLDVVNAFTVIFGNGNGGGEFDIFTNTSRIFGRTRFTGDRDVSVAASTATLYHIAWAFKSGDMQLYINGASVGTNTLTGTIVDNNNNLYFGCRSNVSAFMNGRMFQANLFNRRLTTAEVGELYNSGAGVKYSDLFGGGGPTPPPPNFFAFF